MSAYSNTISNMSFIGALLIVALHTIPIPHSETEEMIIDLLFHKSGFLSATLLMFFGISGYLLVGHIEKQAWWFDAVKKRILSILVPFYIWTLMFIIVKFIFFTLSHLLQLPVVTPNPCPNGIGWLIIELLGLDVFHQTGVVWYLRSLFLYVLVSPLFVFLAKKSYWLSGVVMIIMLYLSRYSSYSVTQINLLDGFLAYTLYLQGLLAFYIGVFIRIHPFKLNLNSTISRCLICSLLVFLIVGGGDGFLVKTLVMITDVLVIYMLCTSIKIPSKLTSLSMPLYLTHMMVKWSIAFALNGLGLYDKLYTSLAFWPFEYFIIVIVSLLIALKMKKTKIYSVLYGGR